MVDAGLVVLVSFISPFRAERRLARERVEDGEFIEVHVDTPLAVAEAARPEGPLREGPRAASCRNFTGIDSPYETARASRGAHRHHGIVARGRRPTRSSTSLRSRGIVA